MEIVDGKIKLSKFEQEVNRIMDSDPEYAQLTSEMKASHDKLITLEEKQAALDEKYDEKNEKYNDGVSAAQYDKIAAQTQTTRDEYNTLYNKHFYMQLKLEKNISAELMQNPEIAKLVDVYE